MFAGGVLVVSFASVFYQLKPATVREKLDITAYKSLDVAPFMSLLMEGSTGYRAVVHTVQGVPEYKESDYGA